MGNLLLDMTLASWGKWPDQPEGWLPGQLPAVVADRRHLESFLTTLEQDPPDDPYEARLCYTAGLMAAEVGPWRTLSRKSSGRGAGGA